MKNAVFWDVAPCRSCELNRRFGEMYRLHLQGRKVSHVTNRKKARNSFGLLFDPEHSKSFLKRRQVSMDYAALHPGTQYCPQAVISRNLNSFQK
jgi:hypothetical protein